jgi:hypothetical protein
MSIMALERTAGSPSLAAAAQRRSLGRSAALGWLTHGGDVGTQNGVDPGLVTRSLGLEPSQDVPINTEGNRLLGNRIDQDRVVPEIVREAREFWRRGALNLPFRDATELPEIRAATCGKITTG